MRIPIYEIKTGKAISGVSEPKSGVKETAKVKEVVEKALEVEPVKEVAEVKKIIKENTVEVGETVEVTKEDESKTASLFTSFGKSKGTKEDKSDSKSDD